MFGIVSFLSFMLVARIAITSGAKILLLPRQRRDQIAPLAGLAEDLVERGHRVYVTIDEHLGKPKAFSGIDVTWLRYKSPDKDRMDEEIDQRYSRIILEDGAKEARAMMDDYEKYGCHSLLKDGELCHRIRKETFDFVIVDGTLSCYSVVPYRLGIPYGTSVQPSVYMACSAAPICWRRPMWHSSKQK